MSLLPYSGLRDGFVSDLLTRFGQTITLRQISSAYTPSTGSSVNTDTDTPVTAVVLPASSAGDQFRIEVIEMSDKFVILAANETAAASIVLSVNDVIVIGGATYTIVALVDLAPAGTTVIWKLMVKK